MLSIAICDENEQARDTIRGYLQGLYAEGFSFSYKLFRNGIALIQHYENGKHYDLIIIDMLSRGRNELATAKAIRQYDAEVPMVVLSSSKEFAVECYAVAACAYLLKPIVKQNFLATVRQILRTIAVEESDYYGFRNKSGWHKIGLSHILYFESNLRKIKVKTKEMEYFFTTAISKVEAKLKHKHFVRVHKSFLVNLAHIIKFRGDSVILANKESLPLSKHKKRILKERLLAFMADDIGS